MIGRPGVPGPAVGSALPLPRSQDDQRAAADRARDCARGLETTPTQPPPTNDGNKTPPASHGLTGGRRVAGAFKSGSPPSGTTSVSRNAPSPPEPASPETRCSGTRAGTFAPGPTRWRGSRSSAVSPWTGCSAATGAGPRALASGTTPCGSCGRPGGSRAGGSWCGGCSGRWDGSRLA
jgi:hypothetical protein